jgi:hypothetical protein|tara:strand:- start:1305 stop:1730 length:426 start_codon:yes stop_codon:yes gene_type:complete
MDVLKILAKYKMAKTSKERQQITQEFIQEGTKYVNEKLKEGHHWTGNGLLSPEEIEKAGYIIKDGKCFIPTEEKIAESDSGSIKKGMKVYVPTAQYLEWYEEFYKNKDVPSQTDNYVDNEIVRELINPTTTREVEQRNLKF